MEKKPLHTHIRNWKGMEKGGQAVPVPAPCPDTLAGHNGAGIGVHVRPRQQALKTVPRPAHTLLRVAWGDPRKTLETQPAKALSF